MRRDQAPPADMEQPPRSDEVTSRTVGQVTKQPSGGPHPRGTHLTRRPWSARRIPAALTALVIGAASGILLYDVARVRAGLPAAAWRSRLADELATRPLDDPWIRIGAAAIAVLGLWLIVLAATPGLRHRTPLRTPDAQMGAVLDRQSAVLLLRDAAMRVPGVSGVRIRMGRHRVGARANVRFRDPSGVRADLLAALGQELDRLTLAHRPSLAVRVRARRK
ncbi:hypothetical protein HYE82_06465 [Streptomyces sp. BR123]|uniref:DUF6286 domain-containing protein n=1 Tax=Streptomyces sp. BR123 TaxID=2749828 RepID=UPI0015C464D9|nr:DUF6286 domain-containing protein [Streptomyces sp. BR123]NXY94042.1 hypothetical protein [Streptomyces sp. BR123]